MLIKTLNAHIYLSSKDDPGTVYMTIFDFHNGHINISLSIDNMQKIVDFFNGRIDEYRKSRNEIYEMDDHDQDYMNYEHNHED